MYSRIDNYSEFESFYSISNSFTLQYIQNNSEENSIITKENFVNLSEHMTPIEDKLHVIVVMSNPCMYKKRYKLLREFVSRMEKNKHVELYIVELAYGDQVHQVTKENNIKHLQLRTTVPMWHKENMINLGVKYLLPSTYKAFAWIDSDIEFENSNWALDTLCILNGSKDIVQLFSHAVDMDKDKFAMSIHTSAGYNYDKGLGYIYASKNNINYSHSGYAWAITRNSYENIGGLYDKFILGGSDTIMLLSLLGKEYKTIPENIIKNINDSIMPFKNKIKNLKFGYISGVIRHNFHGSIKNRKYSERWNILVKHNYSPNTYITYDKKGILIPTDKWPEQLSKDIYNYFSERNEDEE